MPAPRLVRRAPLAALLLALPAASGAVDREGRFAIKGAGIATCERYTAARVEETPRFFAFAGWLAGYLTAVNQFSDDTFDLLSWERIGMLLALLDSHCKANPDDQFFAVVESMTLELAKTQLDEASPAVEVAVGERRTRMYRETLRRMQAALAKLGHYRSEPDGEFGPATREALAAFQKAGKLEATGFPDQRTLLRLFRPPG